MAELKTKPHDGSVEKFLSRIADAEQREDARALAALMQQITGAEPKMWGAGIVGFGTYHYRYASGREGDWFLVGFSPRKRELTLYVMTGFEAHADLMPALGKCKTAKSCLYVKRLSDLHLPTLRKLLRRSVAHLQKASRRAAEAASRTVVQNVNVPGREVAVDAAKYRAMKAAFGKVLPAHAPGLTQSELAAAVVAHLPQDLFPHGQKAAWWAKTVQLDLEAKGKLVREATRPLRWHRKGRW